MIQKTLKNFHYYFLALLSIVLIIIFLNLNREKDLIVAFLNIGQGDAAFIETPSGNQIMIDAGPDGKRVLRELGKLMPFFDRTIDLTILSHPNKDHLAGFIDVLKRYKIKYSLSSGAAHVIPEFKEWEKLANDEKIKKVRARRGLRVHLDNNVYLDILAPLGKDEYKDLKSFTDSMVVVRLVYGKTSFLFTGDMTAKNEYELLSANTAIDSDVLKVAHHGSRYSSGENWLQAVSPIMAIIQVGKNNKYGHPTRETLSRLEKFLPAHAYRQAGGRQEKPKISRTDVDGTIILKSDGEKIY